MVISNNQFSASHPEWPMDMIDKSSTLRPGFVWKTDDSVPTRNQRPTKSCLACLGAVYEMYCCPVCYNQLPSSKDAPNLLRPFCSRQCLYDSTLDKELTCHHKKDIIQNIGTDEATRLNTKLNHTAREGLFTNLHFDTTKNERLVLRYIIHPARSRDEVFKTNLPELDYISSSYQMIKTELATYLSIKDQHADETPWVQAGISTSPHMFRQMHLVLMGRAMPLGHAHFPNTLDLFRQLPVSLVTISVMGPNNRVEWHAGFREYSENCIRFHLPLIVPAGGNEDTMALNVMNHAMNWKEGKLFGFDDCDQHEAYNFTDGTRYVLLFDLIRPQSMPHRHNVWNSEQNLRLFNSKVPYQALLPALTDDVVKQNFDLLRRVTWKGL